MLACKRLRSKLASCVHQTWHLPPGLHQPCVLLLLQRMNNGLSLSLCVSTFTTIWRTSQHAGTTLSLIMQDHPCHVQVKGLEP